MGRFISNEEYHSENGERKMCEVIFLYTYFCTYFLQKHVCFSAKIVNPSTWLLALEDAMRAITKYGGAEPGDRTMVRIKMLVLV